LASRALIVAIEHYPPNLDLASELPETHASALKFRAWLKGTTRFTKMTEAEEPSRIVICADDPAFPGRTHGSSAQAIRQAVYDLWLAGNGSTNELFVYYSGHGFLYKKDTGSRAADVIVPGDFRNAAVDGNLCFTLAALQGELLECMGPGNHYYFVDACRNQIDDTKIAVGSPVRLPRSAQAHAQVFTLFSTSRLSTALAASPFTELLVGGLSGRGKAKQPAGGVPPMMRVGWSSLLDYMKKKLPAVDGAGDGANMPVLWEGPVKNNTCTIVVDNASQDDLFTVKPADSMNRAQAPFQFSGGSATWQQPPDDYRLEVTHATSAVRPVDPLPPKLVDLFEDVKARFVLEVPAAGFGEELESMGGGWSGAVAEREVPAITQLSVIAAGGSRIRMINPVSGEIWEDRSALSTPARPDLSYMIEAYDHDNTLIVRRTVSLDPGEQRTLDLRFPDTPLRQAIASYFPGSAYTGIDFSESLGGSITDPDLGLWLTLMAASRVLGPDRFSKLGPLPLATFDDVASNGSAIYVLSGFDAPPARFHVGVGTDAIDHAWHTPAVLPTMPGLSELKLRRPPGRCVVSLAVGDAPSRTIASFTLPNRATVVIVTGAPGELEIQQLLLPIRGLEPYLDPMVRALLPTNPLRSVKFIAQSQRQLARRRSVMDSTGQLGEWSDSLYGKWLDPMMGVVACYEMLRLGRAQELTVALDNLARYFADLPDTAALLKLAGRGGPLAAPQSPPLVTEGYAAFPDGTFPVLPGSRLEYGTFWTTWRNAVARDDGKGVGATA